MKDSPSFVEYTEQDGNIEVHVAGYCLRRTSRGYEMLLGKRNSWKTIWPDKWEGGGGKVRPGESFGEAIQREMREEFGVHVEVITPIGTYEIDAPFLPQQKIPGVKLLCRVTGFVNGQEPRVDGVEMTEWRWCLVSDLQPSELIPGVREDALLAAKLWSVFESGTSFKIPSS